jgi:hypothetical protein
MSLLAALVVSAVVVVACPSAANAAQLGWFGPILPQSTGGSG